MCLRASKTSLPISFIFSSSDSSRFSNIASACFASFASISLPLASWNSLKVAASTKLAISTALNGAESQEDEVGGKTQ